MSTTIDVQGNTVNAGDILLRLDALADGYHEVLQTARAQLEAFEITEGDWARLAEKLTRNIDYPAIARAFQRQLDAACIASLYPMPESHLLPTLSDDDRQFVQMLNRIADRVLRKVEDDRIKDLVRQEISAQITPLQGELSAMAEAAAERTFANLEHEVISRCREQEHHFQRFLQAALGHDLHAVIRTAIQEAQASGTANDAGD